MKMLALAEMAKWMSLITEKTIGVFLTEWKPFMVFLLGLDNDLSTCGSGDSEELDLIERSNYTVINKVTENVITCVCSGDT